MLCTIPSAPQEAANMALTVTTIKDTRFLTFNTPCVQDDSLDRR